MKIIETLKQICEQLQSTNSSKEKQEILKTHKDNMLFKNTIYFLLNNYITTGLSSKKINKDIKTLPKGYMVTDIVGNTQQEEFENLLCFIQRNNTGRDVDILKCINYFSKFEKDMQEFIKSILTKSLKLGIDAKTVNKVWGNNFIPTFECMLANKYFDKPSVLEGKYFTITLKLDGIRCVLIKENGKVSLFSRQGQKIEGLLDIENEIANLQVDGFMLDGELLITDTTGILSKEQYKTTTKIVRKDGIKAGITYRAFDFMKLDEFKAKDCRLMYSERRSLFNYMFDNLQYTKPLPVLYSGNDTNMIIKILDQVRAEGEEGIMINLNNDLYEFKRTNSLLKCKVMSDCDLEITGFEEGSGRLVGTLGRINVDYKGGQLGVGSGFSDSDRKWFWDNKDSLIGRVIKVQYFEETQDKDGKLSLRFPVFKELREVGKEVSYS